MSRLIHLCSQHWGKGSATGVPRFSRYFQMAFPEAIQATPADLGRVRPRPGDVVVTDNHLSLQVQANVRTVVVHHGCAQTHYDRDRSWQSSWSKSLCTQQREMFRRPFRTYVAPSRWVAEEFRKIVPPGYTYTPVVIPHWVPRIRRTLWVPADGRPVVIGDWSNVNKGGDVIPVLKEAMPEFRFERLRFDPADDAARERAYREANVYLCVSMSEGAPYSVADAEAAGLPIVTTEVGYVREFPCEIVRRDDVEGVRAALARALNSSRGPSFFETWTFERWRDAWKVLVG